MCCSTVLTALINLLLNSKFLIHITPLLKVLLCLVLSLALIPLASSPLCNPLLSQSLCFRRMSVWEECTSYLLCPACPPLSFPPVPCFVQPKLSLVIWTVFFSGFTFAPNPHLLRCSGISGHFLWWYASNFLPCPPSTFALESGIPSQAGTLHPCVLTKKVNTRERTWNTCTCCGC